MKAAEYDRWRMFKPLGVHRRSAMYILLENVFQAKIVCIDTRQSMVIRLQWTNSTACMGWLLQDRIRPPNRERRWGGMNLSAKCNCCVCEPVCKYKEVYQNGVQSILNMIITADEQGAFWKMRECPHIEVSIRCPHMIPKGGIIQKGGEG